MVVDTKPLTYLLFIPVLLKKTSWSPIARWRCCYKLDRNNSTLTSKGRSLNDSRILQYQVVVLVVIQTSARGCKEGRREANLYKQIIRQSEQTKLSGIPSTFFWLVRERFFCPSNCYVSSHLIWIVCKTWL